MTVPSNFAVPSGEWASGFDVPIRAAQAEPPKPVEPAQPKPLAIVLPFIEREREQVLRLLGYVAKLSGKPLRRALYLVPFKGLKTDDVLAQARAAFSDVQVIADSEGVTSDWKVGDKVRDAAGPNSLFRQAAWFFYLKPALGPWLWMEPDCVPLVRGWDEAIEAAYRSAGKPFMGARMKFASGDYLNGAAVYPRDAVARAPALVTRSTWTQFPDMEIAFDVAGGAEVLRQAALTDLIALGEPREGSVLFHGDRDGELLKNLSGARASDDGPRRRDAGDGPTATKRGTVQKRKRGDAKCAVQVAERPTVATTATAQRSNTPRPQQSNGAEKFDPESAPTQTISAPMVVVNGHFEPTVGDEIRYHIGALVRLASNANRRTRILKGLRQTTLLPRIAR